MGWIQVVSFVFQLIFKIWDAMREADNEKRKQKTEALQSGLRGIVDRDASRIVASFDELRRLRKK